MSESKEWKPEVGKTAWGVVGVHIYQYTIVGECRGSEMVAISPNNSDFRGERYVHRHLIYPTALDALKSIKVYDLEGNEVVVSRAQDKIIDEMCARAAENISYLKDWDDADYAELGIAPIINGFEEIIAVRTKAALNKLAEIVWNMDVPPNPGGEARLRKAQERFAKLGERPTDERVESDC